MHIYLVRHTKYHNPENVFPFHLPVYLSTEGREHAQRIAGWFASHNLHNLPIYTSPIVRCVQTAEILASKIDSFVMTDDRLIETSSPNIQGTVQPSEDAWRYEDNDPSRETQESIRERVTGIFQEKQSLGTDCILVSHGDPLTILYYHLQNKPIPEDLWSPENEDKVISRGELVDVEITQTGRMSFEKYQV